MLTADLGITGFSANGTNLLVDYDITGANVAAFNISIYRSSDGTTLDALLQSQRMTASADLQVGTGHRLTLSPSFTDVDSDYFLVAVLDSSGEISEASEVNNQKVLANNSIFKNSDGVVHVHGTPGSDLIEVMETSQLYVKSNGVYYGYTLGTVETVRIRAHNGNDQIVNSAQYSSSAKLVAWGGSGNDTILGGVANDIFYGGDGDDVIYGMQGNDTVIGQDGNDQLYAGAGDDMLEGGAGNDYLDGGAGNDAYRFWGNYSLGTDTIGESANNGIDTLDFSNAEVSGIGLDLRITGTNVQFVDTYLNLILSNSNAVENVIGSEGNDYITGNDLDNVISGLGGNDTIEGSAGDDLLDGGDGDDAIYGGAGNDVIHGGAGDDELYGDLGTCNCATNDSDTIYGEDGDDFLSGDGDVDYLYGGSGTNSYNWETRDTVIDG